MRVSFDSNAWEAIFDVTDTHHAPIRAALRERRIDGFICASAFRIEAVRKSIRPSYFRQPHMEVSTEIVAKGNCIFGLRMSMGPANSKHPGVPKIQAEKLERARAAGIQLMYGQNWMGLPVPPELAHRTNYVHEEEDAARAREERQLLIFSAIRSRQVGRAAFDAVGGWMDRSRTLRANKSETSPPRKFRP